MHDWYTVRISRPEGPLEDPRIKVVKCPWPEGQCYRGPEVDGFLAVWSAGCVSPVVVEVKAGVVKTPLKELLRSAVLVKAIPPVGLLSISEHCRRADALASIAGTLQTNLTLHTLAEDFEAAPFMAH